jgi:hypothetical protein
MFKAAKWYFVNIFEALWGLKNALMAREIASMWHDGREWQTLFDAETRSSMAEGQKRP